ncbi:MAG: WGR domain-containing protein [Alphaproteobacteria bacterium]|nr:WGR domain-containing protein [Alphaproteobacteria bacterium]
MQDGKHGRFWRIEHAGCAFAITSGETGSIGKFEVKEFAQAEDCAREVKRRIAAIIAEGYVPDGGFDADKQVCFDDHEVGPHPLSSHPALRRHFQDAFYYDCKAPDAPFAGLGGGGGHDALSHIEKDFRRQKSFRFTEFPERLVETLWEMTWVAPDENSEGDVEYLLSGRMHAMGDMMLSDEASWATAYAQIRITGRIDRELKTMALDAMRRQEVVAEVFDGADPEERSEIRAKMIVDLEVFES